MLSGKLVLLGASEVGKSCIALRYVRNTFAEGQPATLGAAFLTQTTEILQNGVKQSFKFEIWDTAGQERFASIAPMYYRGSQFALVVYDVSDAASFDRAKSWVMEVRQKSMANTIIAMAGNKADYPRDKWATSSEEAKKFAAMNNVIFRETSAKSGMNINDIFQALAQQYADDNKCEADKAVVVDVKQKGSEKASGCC